MRRFAFAVAFLLVIGLMAAGVFTRSRPPDARSLLISAAQAMEEAKTVHLMGRGGPEAEELATETAEPPPGAPKGAGGMGGLAGASEGWLTNEGYLQTAHEPTGELVLLVCGDLSTGEAHRCLPRRKLVITYHLGVETMKRQLAADRRHYTDAIRELTQRDQSDTRQLTTRTEVEYGRKLTVVSWPVAVDESGAVQQSLEDYLDPTSGRLVLTRVRGPEKGGSPVLRTTRIEYDVPVPKGKFTFRPKLDYTHHDGYFKVFPDGTVHLAVPGDGTDPAEAATQAGGKGAVD